MAEPDVLMPAAGRFTDGEFRFPVRVYYEDTDSGGVVYHAAYLRFAERARTEMLRALGVGQSQLRAEHDVGLVVRRCSIDFRTPARLDDALEIRTRITAVKGASLDADQRIVDARTAGVLVDLAMTIACVTGAGRPIRMPEPVRHAVAVMGTA